MHRAMVPKTPFSWRPTSCSSGIVIHVASRICHDFLMIIAYFLKSVNSKHLNLFMLLCMHV